MGDFVDNSGGMTSERRKFIHDHRKKADTYGPELPYQLGNLKKKFGSKPKEIEFECSCGHISYGTKNTFCIICTNCGEIMKQK